jgi:hypothetical protein
MKKKPKPLTDQDKDRKRAKHLAKLAQALSDVRLNEGWAWVYGSQAQYKDAKESLDGIVAAAEEGLKAINLMVDQKL